MSSFSNYKCKRCKGYAAKSKFGWKRYFEERQTRFIQTNNLCNIIFKLRNDPVYEKGVSKHLQDQITDMFKDAKKSIECNICLEAIEFKNLKSGRCGHHYCTLCINEWLKKSNECPTCKKQGQF